MLTQKSPGAQRSGGLPLLGFLFAAQKEVIMGRRQITPESDNITEEGYYWATSVRRNTTKRRPWIGQVGGYREIVRLFKYTNETVWRVQCMGEEELREISDFKDYDGPIGKGHWVE